MKEYSGNYLIPLILMAALLSCSTGPVDVSDGGTDYPNTKTIAGVAVTSQGTNATNTQVMLIPERFNPTKDVALPDSLIDTTGMDGTFRFTLSDSAFGTFNIHAVQLDDGTQWFKKGVTFTVPEDTLKFFECHLTDPGAVNIVLPDTVDTANGYIYIEGTNICQKISGVTLLSGNHYSIILNTVPAACLPSLVYVNDVSDDDRILISDTTVVFSNDTVIAGTMETDLKPVWRFSVIVGVTEETVQFYNDLDSILPLIEDHLDRVGRKFNDPKIFDGFLEFCVDSLYRFSTPVDEEKNLALAGFDYRLLYDGYSDQNSGSWNKTNNCMYQVWDVDNGEGLFGDLSLDVLTWLFGMGRGCLPLSWMTVRADDNPVNGQAYSGITSIMNDPFGIDKWDEYNILVINYEADTMYDGNNFIHNAFPASMGIVARSAIGLPLEDAAVSVYGVTWSSRAVSETVLLEGTTDSYGKYVFTENPFRPDTCDGAIYGNLLITAVHETDTACTWMPINEVGLAYFKDPLSDFSVNLTFDKAELNCGAMK